MSRDLTESLAAARDSGEAGAFDASHGLACALAITIADIAYAHAADVADAAITRAAKAEAAAAYRARGIAEALE